MLSEVLHQMQATNAGTTSARLDLEVQFVQKAWSQRLRTDKRLFQQLREVSVSFPTDDRGTCVVQLGQTSVMASVVCEVVEPSDAGGGKNGFLDFNVKYATRGLNMERRSTVVEVTRMLEAIIKTSKALDVEALCLIPGQYVWSVRVDVTILNEAGNVTDAAAWATMAALQHTRREEVSVHGDDIIIHPAHERNPIPLSIHHFPLAFTCALIGSTGATAGSTGGAPVAVDFVIDPTTAETAACAGFVTVALNHELQVCDTHKYGVADVSYPLIRECIAAARSLVPQLAALMKEAMATDEQKRIDASKAQFLWAKKRLGVGKQ